MKYLRVDCEVGTVDKIFEALDPLTEYSEDDLREMAADLFNNEYSYGYRVVDESEVPEGER